MDMKRAVITGMGAVTPLGNNVNAYWENMLAGKSGAAAITRFDPINHKTKFACEVKDFDPLNYFDRKEARKLDRYTQYALIASEECLLDSSLDLKKTDLNKVGVILATGIGGIQSYEEEVLAFGQNNEVPRFSPFFITKMIGNIASGHISIRYGFRGINYATVSACASSNHAIANAFDQIRLGKANIVLAGGSEAAITKAAVGGFNSIKAMSTNNENAASASRPFDVTRDGFVLGEGAGLLMVEELEHALQRGAKIYCELVGYGAAADAYHVTATHPEGVGAELAMTDALADAKMQPGEVDYINTHATSTPVGDIGECLAIDRIFGETSKKVFVSATKSMTGHLLGAAGAIEAIATIKAVECNQVPPTINTKNIDPEIPGGLNIVLQKPVKTEINAAMSNTFGFGGHTVSTIFKKVK
ncbi:beta-ketoacyl-ACP synthase II [Maribellus comscasis]|uniref:3-oxoacyl-[acyl-carrier-protein] synthase 2 n=2 Tax=Maribellus comscasis TaxID=2681766 RepID=A0A6I6K088_9BACT|nr:beta-ketoacyl-ACP synthase II [Maribellus comscasis]